MKRNSCLRFAFLFLFPFFCLLSLGACKTTEDTSAAKAEHTNQCIKDLGGLSLCQELNVIGIPKDLQGCCDGLRTLAVDNCQCSPALDNILGPKGKKVYNLESVCRLAQPTKWAKVTPFMFHKCENLKTHNYGCEKSDIEIDAERFASIQKFSGAFAKSGDEKQCLNTPAFTDELATAFTDDITFNVPYGIGTYKGVHNVAEYLGMAFIGLTHGYWFNDITPDPNKKARLEVSNDGLTWTTGSTSKGNFMRGHIPYQDLYLEQDIKFRGCETRISEYNVHPTEGMRYIIETIVQTAGVSKRWGVEDICRYHTQFCANDPTTKQYESEQACLDYMRSLPLYTKACGPNRPLNGHSIACKLKHHFMIPANPKMHCPHIGPKGQSDPDQHMKCDDVAECSEDQGQDQWPAIVKVGDKIPADLRKIFDKTNADFKKEPMGCAVPSTEGDHIH